MRLRLPKDRPGRISAKLLVWCSIATIAGFSAVCGSMMFDMRRGEQALALRSMENLATTIDSDISRNVELYDLSLRNVASNMIEPELAGVSKRLLNLILFDHAATAKHYGAIQVFDAAGNLIHDSATYDPKPENRARRGLFHSASRQSQRGPVHRPSGPASRRLCDCSQPQDHGQGRRLSRCRRRLSAVQLLPRSVRAPQPCAGRHYQRHSTGWRGDYEDAIRSGCDRPGPQPEGGCQAHPLRIERIIRSIWRGRSDRASLRLARQQPSARRYRRQILD